MRWAAWLQAYRTTVGAGNTITVGPGTYDLGGDPTQYNDLRLFNNRWQSDPSQPRPVIVPGNYSVEAGGLYLVLDRLEFDFPANSAGLNLFGYGTYDHLLVKGPGTPCVILGGALVDSACVSTGSAGSGLGVGNGSASSTDAGAVTLLNDTFIGSAGGLGVYNSARYAGANAHSCPANLTVSATNIIALGTGGGDDVSVANDTLITGCTTQTTLDIDHSNYTTTSFDQGPSGSAAIIEGPGNQHASVPLLVNGASGDVKETAASPTIGRGNDLRRLRHDRVRLVRGARVAELDGPRRRSANDLRNS